MEKDTSAMDESMKRRENEMVFDNSIIALTGILSGDRHLWQVADEKGEGESTMSEIMEERNEIIIEEILENYAQIEELEKENANLQKQLAENYTKTAELNKEICELKEKIKRWLSKKK